jgi:hypothetical protein
MKKVFPIEIEDVLHRRLKHAAIDAGMTLHAWILKVLGEHVDHNGSDSTRRSKNRDKPQRRGR